MSNELTIPMLHDENSTQLFEKRTIVELTDSELADVQGGTTPACVVAASIVVAGAWTVIQIAKAGYEFGQWLQ